LRGVATATLRSACLAMTCALTLRSQRSENDHEPSHGQSPVWRPGATHSRTARNLPRAITNPRLGEALFDRQDLHTDAPLHRFQRRSRTHAWAKPCLAGRPTALVRTQPPEKNTSRGRPSGMELPDYPVIALTPTPWDQDGPTPPLPARSFPRFVSRSASRPVFSQIRSSFCCPPAPDLIISPSHLL
jgi:hypothetical protein